MVAITMDQSDTKHLQKTLKRQLWSEAGLWMQDRAQTLWDSGMPDEAAALYSEFARGPAMEQASEKWLSSDDPGLACPESAHLINRFQVDDVQHESLPPQ